MSRKRFFITGTGTGVGKTFATACLADFFVRHGLRTAVTKPFQTGAEDGDDDIELIQKAVPGLAELPPELRNAFRFRIPASPELAARAENASIDISKIAAVISEIEKEFSPDALLIEGAGGLYVPVKKDIMMIDIIKMLGIPVILVCDSGLGTINHSILSVRALQAAGIDCAGFIFNKASEAPGIIEKDNLEVLKEVSGIPFIGTIKKIPSISEINPSVYSFPGLA